MKVRRIFLDVFLILIISEMILRCVAFFYLMYYTSRRIPSVKPDEKSFRIICVGESTTAGYPVTGKGYPEQLEQLLNRNSYGEKFRVFNLGVCAITSREIARHFYKNIIDYQPQLVIILAGTNNNKPRLFTISKNEKAFDSIFFYFVDKSNELKTFKLLKLSYEVLSGLVEKTFYIQRIHEDFYITYRIRNYPFFDEQEVRKDLEYMTDVALKNGCKVLICNYFHRSQVNIFLKEFARDRNIPFCDNEKIFKEYPDPYSLTSQDSFHPNFKGYSFMAQNLYNTIIQYGLIPKQGIN